MSPVSDELFRRQLEVTEKLAVAVVDNSATTHQVAATQKDTMELLREVHEKEENAQQRSLEEVKRHVSQESEVITERFNIVMERLEFWKKPQFWIAITILAASSASDTIAKIVEALKH